MYPAPYLIRPGGRALTVEDSGPQSGLPVLVHSAGGSRHLFPPAVRDARCEGLRLISYDRPAYGGSTPVPGRVVADCAADVQAIAAELGITRLAVWGFSGGGPYALATAALLPDVVVAVCVFAPLGPYGADGLDFLAGMEDSYREEVRIFFQDRRAAREKFRAEAAEMYQLWHGLADTRCPPDHSRWLAGRIPHITAHFPEHEDHTNVEENNRAAAFAWLRGFIDSRVRETRAG